MLQFDQCLTSPPRASPCKSSFWLSHFYRRLLSRPSLSPIGIAAECAGIRRVLFWGLRDGRVPRPRCSTSRTRNRAIPHSLHFPSPFVDDGPGGSHRALHQVGIPQGLPRSTWDAESRQLAVAPDTVPGKIKSVASASVRLGGFAAGQSVEDRAGWPDPSECAPST